MNRIRPEASLIDPMLSVAGIGVVEPDPAPRVSGRGPYSLFGPLHYEANYAYPLIVWLHGPGDDEHQLRRIMPAISLRNYVAVARNGRRFRRRSDPGRSRLGRPSLVSVCRAANRPWLATNRRPYSGGRVASDGVSRRRRGKISYCAGPLLSRRI